MSAMDLSLPPPSEGSEAVANRVAQARKRSVARGVRSNAELEGELLDQHCALEDEARALLLRAAEKLNLSARGYTRVLRVSRTIADLGGSARVARPHVAEALSYRQIIGR